MPSEVVINCLYGFDLRDHLRLDWLDSRVDKMDCDGGDDGRQRPLLQDWNVNVRLLPPPLPLLQNEGLLPHPKGTRQDP